MNSVTKFAALIQQSFRPAHPRGQIRHANSATPSPPIRTSPQPARPTPRRVAKFVTLIRQQRHPLNAAHRRAIRSPKFSTIRQNTLRSPRIHTALIWLQLRLQFGSAHRNGRHFFGYFLKGEREGGCNGLAITFGNCKGKFKWRRRQDRAKQPTPRFVIGCRIHAAERDHEQFVPRWLELCFDMADKA